MRLGISSYTFVWGVAVPGYPPPPRPLDTFALLDRAVRLGVRVVQIADNLPLAAMSGTELDELVRRARQNNIDLEAGTSGIERDHLLACLEIAGRLESSLLRVVIDHGDRCPSPQEAITALGDVAPDFLRAGVTLAIENHDRFPAATLAQILEQFDSRTVGLCLDTANSLGCGEGLDTLMRVLGRYVVNLHIKDFQAVRLPHNKGFVIEGRPAGQGQVDIPRLLAELRAAGRDPNAIVELWPPPESSVEATIAKEDAWAEESVRYLRRFISE